MAGTLVIRQIQEQKRVRRFARAKPDRIAHDTVMVSVEVGLAGNGA
jgi:hypothetical protein